MSILCLLEVNNYSTDQMVYKNILETIGKTPLVRLNKIASDVKGEVYVKLESFNPGNSAKDRIALHMIEKAESNGQLSPGDTLVEASSGNTGFGLAMVARVKGYRCLITVSDTTSQSKINMLKALGADVVLCQSGLPGDDPRSKYSRAKQLSEELPNCYYVDQNYNLDNAESHYLTTGKEIWEDTAGKVTHLVACTGTGGTLCGTARYLKEMNPDIQIWAIDGEGSTLLPYYKKGHFDQDEVYSNKVEGLGKDIIPKNVNFDIIDHMETVNDRDSALAVRQLALDEGILAGYSSGSVVQGILQLKDHIGAGDLVVGILPDHGSRYLEKPYNDQWMEKNHFFQEELVSSNT